MLSTIFRYELRHWLRQPSTYIYAFLLLFVSTGTMAARAGLFGEQAAVPGQVTIANAPLQFHEMTVFFLKLFLFILPAIIGGSVYRDFQSNMHAVLYAYPLTKKSYLSGKFFSSLFIAVLVASAIGAGLFLGASLPWIDPALVIPFKPAAFLQTYLVFVLPDILLFSAIIFAVVTFTRNIYAGFIVIVLLAFLQGLGENLLGGPDHLFLAALIDPLGQKAADYHSRYWTFAERNELLLPIKGVVIYNRLLWLSVAAVLLGMVYKQFAFRQHAPSLPFRSQKQERAAGKASGGILKIKLPKVRFHYSFLHQLKTCWRLSNIEFRYIITSWMFISILFGGILFIFFQQAQMNPPYGFKTLPVTWMMLRIPGFLFSGIILLLTFLYAGMLVHRARAARMDQLVDVNPLPNWVFLGSKFLALIKMQLSLLSLVMIGGVVVQVWKGYHHFEPGLYLFHLIVLQLPGLVIWAMAALFVQSLFTNPYLGLFLLILGGMGLGILPEMGIEHWIFRYNHGPETSYSDLDGYGASLPAWLLYKVYWALAGLVFLTGAFLFWIRGLPLSFAERLQIAGSRFKGRTAVAGSLFVVAFIALGAGIYYADQISYTRIQSAVEEELWQVENEKRYKQYENSPQPRITAVKVNMHLFPESRDFKADGEYTLVNRSARAIDTLLIHYSYDEMTKYRFDRPARVISRDTFIRFDVHILEKSLSPGDSLGMYFEMRNETNTLFHTSSPVRYNGTFFTNEIFPGLGYRPIELKGNGRRATYGLPAKNNDLAHPSDSSALGNSYSSGDADWIRFEATVSTSEDQIALAPGYLLREWKENGRRYFHYKMDSPIKDFYGFNSGRFEVVRDRWKNIDLEIYYHKEHTYNLDRMMSGLKGALAYNTRNFSPYQHRQARIIEFPVTIGGFATTFANSIPFSEVHFMTDTGEQPGGGLDFPFYISAHEMAHQWWGNQLIPADVLGAKMLTESLAEYTALKVLEKEYGKSQMRRFLQFDLDLYLKGRGNERNGETPLMYSRPHQNYINYRKGALVFYALGDYIGEERLNGAIRTYLKKVQFQEAPYTTSLELMDYIRKATPDSLQYLIGDMFETITFYDNRMSNVSIKPLADGRYAVKIDFLVSKYRSDGQRTQTFEDENGRSLYWKADEVTDPLLSLPLADYIEVGVFGEAGSELYLKKHKITGIDNTLTIIVDKKPAEVGVDPFNKLIDINPWDNRRSMSQ